MRFTTTSVLVFAIFALSAEAGAQPAADSGARAALASRYRDQDSAISQRNLRAFLSTLGTGYAVTLRDDHNLTRPGVDSAIARDMRATRGVRLAATEITKLTTSGDTLVAVVVHRTDRDIVDEDSRVHRWENGVRYEERWTQVGGRWYIISLRELEQIYLWRDDVDQAGAASRASAPTASDSIRAVVARYLRGLKFNDTLSFQDSFWPGAHLYFVGRDGQLGQLSQAQWYASFAASLGHEEAGDLRIVALDMTKDAASVKVVEDYPRSRYTDYVSLLRLGGRWWIVNKIYTVERRTSSPPS